MRERSSAETDSGLVGASPTSGGFRLSEEINLRWLWLVVSLGLALVVVALLLDLVWAVDNILPNASLSLGIGMMLFAVLFLAERRIVRRTNIVWISAIEELAARIGQDPEELDAHFSGPVAVVQEFVSAILDDGEYDRAWSLADHNWRLCRVQAWIWNNRDHPLLSPVDRDDAVQGLSRIASTHELWPSFAETELEQFREVWLEPDLRTYGATSATRKVEDGEIILLIDLSEYPAGAVALGPTEVVGVPFLVREVDGAWRLANLVGDRLPLLGWPPDWRERWEYWDMTRRGGH